MKNTFTQTSPKTFVMERGEGYPKTEGRMKIRQAFTLFARWNNLPYAFDFAMRNGRGEYVIYVRPLCKCCGR